AASRVGGVPSRRGGPEAIRAPLTLALQRLRDLEGELDRLAGIEPRVAMRQVVGGETLFADLLSAADALRDVLPRQFEMHAAGVAALGEMDREGAVQLVEDPVEHAGLVAGRGS